MAKFNDKQLNKHIKEGNFLPVYVIYGEEQMYVKSFTEKLVRAVAGKEPSEFNFHMFSGDVDLDDFAAALQIVPFMSRYNCVVLSDMYFDNCNSDDLKRFSEITGNIPDGTVLILSMPTYKPSKNKAAFTSFVKTADKSGAVCEFKRITQSETEKFIAKWANSNGKTISQINAAKLIAYCGGDLNLLKNEVDKICAYAKGGEVTLEDIEKLACVNLESKIFTLSDAVLNGNAQKAFNTLDVLFYQREEPIMMLYALSSSYIDAYRIRVADECGVSKQEVAKTFDYKSRAFALDSARRATGRVNTQALRKSLDLLIKADTDFKTAPVNARLYMEQLIAQLLLIAKEGRV